MERRRAIFLNSVHVCKFCRMRSPLYATTLLLRMLSHKKDIAKLEQICNVPEDLSVGRDAVKQASVLINYYIHQTIILAGFDPNIGYQYGRLQGGKVNDSTILSSLSLKSKDSLDKERNLLLVNGPYKVLIIRSWSYRKKTA